MLRHPLPVHQSLFPSVLLFWLRCPVIHQTSYLSDMCNGTRLSPAPTALLSPPLDTNSHTWWQGPTLRVGNPVAQAAQFLTDHLSLHIRCPGCHCWWSPAPSLKSLRSQNSSQCDLPPPTHTHSLSAFQTWAARWEDVFSRHRSDKGHASRTQKKSL